MIEKVLPIAETLYFRYFNLFIGDNTTSYLVYAKDILYIYKINKRPNNKQVILCNGWYIDQINMYYIQLI